MRKKIIAGNWKMCGSRTSVKTLLSALKQEIPSSLTTDVIVFPPFVFLSDVQDFLKNSLVQHGAQNMNDHESGAYTGEISAAMLKEFGCNYVLIGHSERRAYYHETNDLLVNKLQAAYQSGLRPIVCVGETEQQREQNKTENVIADQLSILFTPENIAYLKSVVIAYEPVWAIGTGKTASPDQAQSVHAFIREQVAQHDKNIANNLSILYGGSVKADNAASLFSMPDIDGGLVGGASLDPQAFLQIILGMNLCNN